MNKQVIYFLAEDYFYILLLLLKNSKDKTFNKPVLETFCIGVHFY